MNKDQLVPRVIQAILVALLVPLAYKEPSVLLAYRVTRAAQQARPAQLVQVEHVGNRVSLVYKGHKAQLVQPVHRVLRAIPVAQPGHKVPLEPLVRQGVLVFQEILDNSVHKAPLVRLGRRAQLV